MTLDPKTLDNQRPHYLHITDYRLLDIWARQVNQMFSDHVGIYLVGSALRRQNYRDVDVRLILPSKAFDKLSISIDDLNMCVSLWGQRVTGLPIDFQVQRMFDANAEFEGCQRNAIGVMV